jgi:putative acetyltransferase
VPNPPLSTPTIRHLEPRDYAAIHAMFDSDPVLDGTMRLPYTSPEDSEDRLKRAPGRIQLVACIDDETVGYANLVTFPNVPRHRHAGEVYMIAVREDMHGRGIGRALMEAMLDLADNWLQLSRVGLMVWATNTRAIRLYESLGFELEGTLKRYVFGRGRYLDACFMGRIREGSS